MRIVEIPVLPGMVRQSLVTFNLDRRKAIISPGEKLKISCPELGISFETELVIGVCRFRDRKNFTKIFTAYRAGEDDVLVLTEKKKNEWVLSMRKRPNGHSKKIAEIKRKKQSPFDAETQFNEDPSRPVKTGHRDSGVNVPKRPGGPRSSNKAPRRVPGRKDRQLS